MVALFICNLLSSQVKFADPSSESVPLKYATLVSAPDVIAETEPPPPPVNSIILPDESTPNVLLVFL